MKALVIGFGSIGRRHAEILSNMEEIEFVSILSNQKEVPYEKIKTLEEIKKIDPDYIVVASPTSQHFTSVKFIEENLKNKKVLVEKPLFGSQKNFDILNNKIYVGYNFRFHPLIQKLKILISNKEIWNFQIYCGSYLPAWRPDRDYRKTSSAKKSLGGGVLLDLSHELDYAQWLIGPIELKYAFNEKISDLDITSDDYLSFFGENQTKTKLHISLNYFTRKSIRKIIIDGNSINIHADLINNSLTAFDNGKDIQCSWENLNRNYTYEAQHYALINDERKYLCTYIEGMNTLKLINKIRSFSS